MNKDKKKIPFKLNIGGPSIILLLTVLGLTVFAILSIRAAYSGLKLARTSRDSADLYYEVEQKAVSAEFAVRELIAASGDTGSAKAAIASSEYVASAADGSVIIRVPMNDAVSLEVVLEGDENYHDLVMTSHRLINTVNDEYTLSAFDFEDPIVIE